jgi:hypothetical protein
MFAGAPVWSSNTVIMQVYILNRKELFSYQSQYTTVHPNPLKWLDGHVIDTVCIYDSASRSNATNFGLGTQDEMCLHSHLVYPESCGVFTALSWRALATMTCELQGTLFQGAN